MKEQILKEFEDRFVKDLGDRVEPVFKDPVGSVGPVREFISETIDKVQSQTRKETIREVEEKEIEIQNILEPYFVVLDGRDNEPAQETIIEISKKILSLLNKPRK